jgi:two-component system, cell cycle response regulator DivK
MARILVVEDDDANRELAARFLMRQGHTVLFAHDGKQAIENALAQSPDLILMDLSLPEMDGWEATRRIKANPATAHIPIIAQTAHALSTDANKALQAGCDDYEVKPLDYPGLMDKIRTVLSIPAFLVTRSGDR